MWHNFSSWLLLTALMFGAFAVLTGIVDFVRPSTRSQMGGFAAALGFVVMLLLGALNSSIHAGDGSPAVVPMGIAVSAATVLVALITYGLAISHFSNQEWRVVQ